MAKNIYKDTKKHLDKDIEESKKSIKEDKKLKKIFAEKRKIRGK